MFLEGNAETSEASGDHFALIALKAAPTSIGHRVRIVTSEPADRLVCRAGVFFYRFFAENAFVIWIIH